MVLNLLTSILYVYCLVMIYMKGRLVASHNWQGGDGFFLQKVTFYDLDLGGTLNLERNLVQLEYGQHKFNTGTIKTV